MSSLELSLQSAPVRSGTVGDPSAWSGSGGTNITVTSGGTYEGTTSVTYTCTIDSVTSGLWQAGDIAVTWTNGTDSGEFNIGSDWYTESSALLLHRGILLYFSGAEAVDVVAAGDSFTVVVTAKNKLRNDHVELLGDADPMDIVLSRADRVDADLLLGGTDNTFSRVPRAILQNPTVKLDYEDRATREKLLALEHARHQLTLGEDYSPNTIFLWRAGRGLLPFIGTKLTFARSGNGSYQDPDTGLLKLASTNEPRFQAGKGSRTITLCTESVTNKLPQFHPKSSSVGWTASGSATVTFDTTMATNLDPDSSWTSDFLDGTARASIPVGDSVKSGTASITVAAPEVTGQVWIRGRGQVSVQLLTGVTTPTAAQVAHTVTLDGQDWQEISVESAAPSGHDSAAINLLALETSIVWIAGAQISETPFPTSIIETDGATATRSAELLSIPEIKIPSTGSVGFWVYFSGPTTGTAPTFINILMRAGAWPPRFDIDFDWNLMKFRFVTKDGGSSCSSNAIPNPGNIWHHIAATWERSSTAGQLLRKIYVDGVLHNSVDDADWETGGWNDVINFGQGGTEIRDVRFEEIRMDSVAWTADQVTRIYNAINADNLFTILKHYGGRKFRIGRIAEQWLSTVHPDKFAASVSLQEIDYESDSLLLDR